MLSIRLRFLRKEKKLTQEEFAKILGISRARYAHYENGIHEPPYEILSKIADYYETTTEYLRGKTDEREKVDKIRYDIHSTSPNLNKILRETTPHWDGIPLTSEQADALITFYEMLIKQNTKKKGES